MGIVPLTWSGALAWRMRRHLLDPVGTGSVEEVVGWLGAVPAGLDAAAELAVRVRRERSEPGEVARALADGRILKTFAFRGAIHLMTPDGAAAALALRASGRMWELPSWQTAYGLAPADWPRLRETVREALAAGPLTHDELGAALVARPEYRHLARAFADGAWTLLEAFAWQGDLCFGLPRDGRATFQRLDDNPRWSGLPDLDDAGTRAVEAYLRSYGPATPAHLDYWLGSGLGAARRRIRSWVAVLGDRLLSIDVDGEPAFVLADDLDEVTATPPTTPVRLLPGHDQWVLGPGTADPHVVPPARRGHVTRRADLVVAGGVVSGTWSAGPDGLAVSWFAEAGAPPREGLELEVARVAAILGAPAGVTVRTA